MKMPEYEPLVHVELTGCPNVVPRMLVPRSTLTEGKLKISFGAGHDHFVLESCISQSGESVPVFTWAYRTRIAE